MDRVEDRMQCKITVIDNDNKRGIYYRSTKRAEMIYQYYRRKCRLHHRIYRHFVSYNKEPLFSTKYNYPQYFKTDNKVSTIHDLQLDLLIDEMARQYGPMPAMQGKATAILEDHFFKAHDSRECKGREVKCTGNYDADKLLLPLCDCTLKLDCLLISYIINNKLSIFIKLSEGCENVLQSNKC